MRSTERPKHRVEKKVPGAGKGRGAQSERQVPVPLARLGLGPGCAHAAPAATAALAAAITPGSRQADGGPVMVLLGGPEVGRPTMADRGGVVLSAGKVVGHEQQRRDARQRPRPWRRV